MIKIDPQSEEQLVFVWTLCTYMH